MSISRGVPCLAGLLLLAGAPSPASAQYGALPFTDPAVGETYRVEIYGGFWSPTPEVVITTDVLGVRGTDIDFVEDLGIEKTRMREFRLVVRPGRKHKLRLAYVPLRYEAATRLQRTIVFSGRRFDLDVDVQTEFNWKAWRFGYEYDFIYRDRGFVGLLAELKYTDLDATLVSPFSEEFARVRAPIPAVGGIARGYVARNVSITGELSFFNVPDIDEDYDGTYVDFDIYGTVNFTDNVGVQVGYRLIDLSYAIERDLGDLRMKGWYFGGVLRF